MKKAVLFTPWFRLVFPLIHGPFSYLLVLFFFDSINQLQNIFFSQEALLCIIISFAFSEGIRLCFRLTDTLAASQSLKKRIIWQVSISLSYTLLIVSGITIAYFIYLVGIRVFHTELLVLNVIYLFTALLINLFCISLLYLHTDNQVLLGEEEFRKNALKLEIQQFQNQINPFFLYKSLEAIIERMGKAPEQIDPLLHHLSETYRYTLMHQKSEWVPLEQELPVLHQMAAIVGAATHQEIRINQAVSKGTKQALLIPGACLDVLQFIVFSSIANPSKEFIIHLIDDCSQHEHSLVFEYTHKQQLVLDESLLEQWHSLSDMYVRLSGRSLQRSQAQESTQRIVLPLLYFSTENQA
ncbi:histidine kinase [Cytophagales bacterium LB-30]|uniref:Histidine kinase n=1 Tax=Shiella aurantiaca TaxID=3058365 RepID=A0ABT8F6M5_9BACT|nr:histidine kinase [Shiella aurantiaca]MDN4166028.1 histidine kinase [Shiella aurantiaca]